MDILGAMEAPRWCPQLLLSLPLSPTHTPKACTKEVMELNYCVLNKLVNTWTPVQTAGCTTAASVAGGSGVA